MSKDDIKPGEQLTLAQINRIRKQQQAARGNGGGAPATSQSDGADKMTVAELREALEAKGIEIPEGAKKAELQKLLDEA